jgi:hypothetical protein
MKKVCAALILAVLALVLHSPAGAADYDGSFSTAPAPSSTTCYGTSVQIKSTNLSFTHRVLGYLASPSGGSSGFVLNARETRYETLYMNPGQKTMTINAVLQASIAPGPYTSDKYQTMNVSCSGVIEAPQAGCYNIKTHVARLYAYHRPDGTWSCAIYPAVAYTPTK